MVFVDPLPPCKTTLGLDTEWYCPLGDGLCSVKSTGKLEFRLVNHRWRRQSTSGYSARHFLFFRFVRNVHWLTCGNAFQTNFKFWGLSVDRIRHLSRPRPSWRSQEARAEGSHVRKANQPGSEPTEVPALPPVCG